MPSEPGEKELLELGGHLGQAQRLRRVPSVVLDGSEMPEEARWLRALQDEQEEKARQGVPHAGDARREMADRREIRAVRMQGPGPRGEILPVHLPGRGHKEEIPPLRERAFHVRNRQGAQGGDRLLRLQAEGDTDRQRLRVLRQGGREGQGFLGDGEGRPEHPRAILPRERHTPQIHPPEDARAQRQSGEKPQDRPGEILQISEVLLPRRPRLPGGEVEQKVQRNPENGAQTEVPEPGGT